MRSNTEFLGCRVEQNDGASTRADDISNAIEILRPKASPRELIRIGQNCDGAYLIPNDLSGIKACYSPGVNNVKYFEDYIFKTYGIASHMCDFTSDEDSFQTPLIAGAQTFKKVWLDTTSSMTSITLSDWVNELSPNPEDDLLLQIDIEGAEYKNLLSCPDETVKRFRIIAMELHALHAILNPDILAQVILPFLQKLDKWFICVHAHPNNCCGDFVVPALGINVPNLIELTFLRRDRFELTEDVTMHPPQLPHPADIDRNVEDKPPLFLNSHWVGSRSLPSHIKMMEENAAYQDFLNKKTMANLNELRSSVEIISLSMNQAWSLIANVEDSNNNADDITEIGIGQPYFISSSHAGTPKMGIVPTNSENFFFHTDFGSNESITVDLGRRLPIKSVHLENRRDSCFERARSLFVIIHNDPDWHGGSAFAVVLTDAFLKGLEPEAEVDIPLLSAQYVSIVSTAHTALHLSQLQIFGIKLPLD